MKNLLGTTIDKYLIEQELGRGGMGIVYRCRHVHLERLQAIKIMHPEMALDPTFQARFRQEAQSISRLDHPNIVKLYDFDARDGMFYITMELVEDGSLRGLLDRRKRDNQTWPHPFGLSLVRQAAEALAYAHGHGIVHRDIKPDNLLTMRQRTNDGRSTYAIKVSDFGLVRLAEGGSLTSMGMTVGTPAYMSPEQCQGMQLDGRSDIYSLGVVLYEVMTGYLPFNTQTISDAYQKHVAAPVPPPRSVRPDLPLDIETVILRCLEKQPEQRYADASALAHDLRDLIRAYSNAPLPTPVSESTTRHIEVYDGQKQLLQAIDLQDGVLTVGRLPDNDIVLPDASVSRKHARIEWNGKRIKVFDLATKLGTRMNGAAIDPSGGQIWQVGEVLEIGAYQLKLLAGTANTVTVSLPPEARQVQLKPGVPVQIPVVVQQSGQQPERFAVLVDEWPAYWIASPVQPIEVPAGGKGQTSVYLLVPPDAIRESASFRVLVRVIGMENPEQSDVTTAIWHVQVPVRPKVAVLLEPASQQAREHARYLVRITNNGEQAAQGIISAQSEQKLAFALEQYQFQLEPGASTEIAVTVRTPGGRWLGGSRTLTFTIQADVQGGDIASCQGTLVQTALLPI